MNTNINTNEVRTDVLIHEVVIGDDVQITTLARSNSFRSSGRFMNRLVRGKVVANNGEVLTIVTNNGAKLRVLFPSHIVRITQREAKSEISSPTPVNPARGFSREEQLNYLSHGRLVASDDVLVCEFCDMKVTTLTRKKCPR